MDDESISALRGFDDIWRRVSGEAPPDAPALDALIDASVRQRERLRALARCFPQLSRRLCAMAAAETELVRRLRAENFLISGEDCRAAPACAVISSPLGALREAYSCALALAESLQAAANAAPCELRGVLDRLAAAERCRARELREIVLRAFMGNWA